MADTQPTHIENWRPIPGYEGLYEVSDHGRVRSVDRVVQTKVGPQRWKGKVLSPITKPSGYYFVALGKKRRAYVHHLVLEAFRGPRPEGHYGCHLDDNPVNNKVDNLVWGTPSDNSYDKVRNGNDHHAKRTHCKNGHEFTPENTRIAESRPGTRFCRACGREGSRRRYSSRVEYKRQWRARRRAEGKPVT